MTKISRYVIDEKVTGSDKWIGSDAQTQYTTKNFTPTKLAVYFNENQIIDIGTPIRYKYDILEVGDTRLPGTITFEPQVGTPYSLSSISSFILSKYTLKGNDVTQYLNFLIGSNVLIYKADDINTFGLYKVVSLVENIDEPDFFDVVVSYTTGNGYILEDRDYLISLIDIPSGDIPTKTSDLINDGEDGVHPFITAEDITPQVNSDWDATSGVAKILNKPTKTSDFTNDGENGVNPFITLEDIIAPTLQSVTDEGNITTNNIEFETGVGIVLDNNSKLKEGTIDAGYGGSKGIAQICAVGYELKWEAGRLYVMGDGGTTIREVSHNFTTIPTIYDDIDKGFIIGSRWILDNGDLYLCLDNSDDAAVWELQIIGTQNLQSVTDEGNITTNSITVDSVDYYSIIEPTVIGTENKDTGNYTYLGADGVVGIRTEGFDGLIKTTNLTEEITLEFPGKPTGIYTIATIEDLSDYVPYEGATQNVDLGVYDITAAHLIKDGGVNTQFLKADGSVDNNVYLTSADLPSTLDLYATTTASDIPGYTVLVRNISDLRFNTTAVDVSTGPITTLGQLVGQLVSDANIISGNPGIFNITTIGNISRTSGTGQAEFFFRVYKRTSAGVETFITESSKTLPVTNGGYSEFSAVALWNDGVFLDTDRVVLKYYADRLTSPVGSNPVYKFQFGGISPVRSTAAVPVAVIPNIYLRDLADVENVDALNNEVLYWNDTASLWEHSSVIGLLSPASSTVNGYLSSTDWTSFNGKFNLPSLTSGSVLFSNGTTIAQDNANFFWDDTNNRLGIGTTAPSTTLDIRTSGQGYVTIGGADGRTISSFNNAGAAAVLNFGAANFNGFMYGSNLFDSATNTQSVRLSSTTISLWSASTERLRVANNGNILIGTTVDQGGKLQVKAPGALSTDIALRVRNSADSADLMTVNGVGQLSIDRNFGLKFLLSSLISAPSNGNIVLTDAAGTSFSRLQFGGSSNLFPAIKRNTTNIEFKLADDSGFTGIISLTSLIGGTSINSSAVLQADSTNKGFLPPRMTNAQRIAIATPAVGLCVYCTDVVEGLYINKSTGWTYIG